MQPVDLRRVSKQLGVRVSLAAGGTQQVGMGDSSVPGTQLSDKVCQERQLQTITSASRPIRRTDGSKPVKRPDVTSHKYQNGDRPSIHLQTNAGGNARHHLHSGC